MEKQQQQEQQQQQQQQEPGQGGSSAGTSAPVPAATLPPPAAPFHPLERIPWGRGEPDSPECVRQRWKELRVNDVEEVRAALVGMLKMACAYRGRVVLKPTGGGAAPQAVQAAQAAAAGADPGPPAGGA